MSSDLLFSILPRQGTVPMSQDGQKVQEVRKLATLRALSDEEKELQDEELEVREKYHTQKDNQEHGGQEKSNQSEQETPEQSVQKSTEKDPEDKDQGPKHLDIYV